MGNSPKIARLLKSVAFVAVSAVVLAGCSSSGDSSSGNKDFQVLVMVGLTGPIAANAEAEVNAMKAAADVLNKDGGILDRNVKVDVIDTQTDPTKAVSLLQEKLGSGYKPDLVWHGVSSDETLALLPALTQRKLLSIGQTAADAINDPSKYPYAFGTQPSAAVAASTLAAQFKSSGAKSVGVIAADNAYGQSTADAVEKALTDSGVMGKRESYSPTAVDLTSSVQRLLASKPDAVFFQGYGAASTYLLKARTKLQSEVPWVGSLSVSATNTTEITPAADLAGVKLQIYDIQKFVPEADRPAGLNTMITQVTKHGTMSEAMNLYSGTYDALMLVAAGAEQAKSADGPKVAKAIESLKTPAKPKWVTYNEWGYSADSHFPVPTQDNSGFAFLDAKPGKTADGMLPE